MTKVYSPIRDFTGRVAGVSFLMGEGDASEASEAALAYFARKGYRLGEEDAPEAPGGSDAPNRSASKADWVEYAQSVGGTEDDVSSMTKDQLIERFGD